MKKNVLFISINDIGLKKAIGVATVTLPEGLDTTGLYNVQAELMDPKGEDAKLLEPNKFYTREEMEKLGYTSSKKPVSKY